MFFIVRAYHSFTVSVRAATNYRRTREKQRSGALGEAVATADLFLISSCAPRAGFQSAFHSLALRVARATMGWGRDVSCEAHRRRDGSGRSGSGPARRGSLHFRSARRPADIARLAWASGPNTPSITQPSGARSGATGGCTPVG